MRIALMGDIALTGIYDKTVNKYVFENLKGIKEIISGCDFAVANLESPFSVKEHTSVPKGVYLKSDPVNVEILKYLGIDAVNLANNHLFDYGKSGYNTTVETLEKAGIKYFGVNNGICCFEKGADKVAFAGCCCYSANAVGYGEKKGTVQTLSPTGACSMIKEMTEAGCYPVISAHFGDENTPYPRQDHIKLFRNLAEKYDYTLHGHHPHVLQGTEKHNNSLLIYSMGDSLFGEKFITSMKNVSLSFSQFNLESMIAIIEITENRLTDYSLLPVQLSIAEKNCVRLTDNDSISKNIDGYSSLLTYTEEKYSEKRREFSNARVSTRKKGLSGKIKFILNRLNLKYIRAYMNGKKNAKKYNELFR